MARADKRPDFRLVQGDTWQAAVYYGYTASQGDVDAILVPGDTAKRWYIPVNLTGYTARLQIKSYPNLTLVDTLTSTDDLAIEGVDGCVRIHSQTAGWAFEVAEYALEVTSPAADITTLAKGLIYLSPEVTV